MGQYKTTFRLTNGDEFVEYRRTKDDLIAFLADLALETDVEWVDITKGDKVIY